VNTIICTVCKTRLSLDDGTASHPHCRGAAPLTEAEMARLTHALGGLLGAMLVQPVEIGRWRASGEPVFRADARLAVIETAHADLKQAHEVGALYPTHTGRQ